MTDRLKKIIDSGRLRRIIIISGIAGIALIFISNFFSHDVFTSKISLANLTRL